MKRTLKIGDTFKATDTEGHLRVYTVIGFYSDGYPKSMSWNAPCADDCPHNDPDRWY